MPFADMPTRTFSETAKRTSIDYVKFSEDYRVHLRILNPKAKLVYKHFIPSANRGRGMSAVCPNMDSQTNACPIEKSVAHLPRESSERINAKARKKWMVNVLDRTPHSVCPSCSTNSPGKRCVSCGADLSKSESKPLNKVKILEAGPQLFTDLNAIEKMQKEDFPEHPEITEYDLVFTTTGSGRERKIAVIPKEPQKMDNSWLKDETGENQKLFDLDLLAEPSTIEEITLMLEGASIEEINATKGVV